MPSAILGVLGLIPADPMLELGMAYSEDVAKRTRAVLAERVDATERKMFGGLCFTVDGHTCCGVVADELMVRVGPEAYESALDEEFARVMDFTGRPLRGMVYVGADGIASAEQLGAWVDRGGRFVRTLPAK